MRTFSKTTKFGQVKVYQIAIVDGEVEVSRSIDGSDFVVVGYYAINELDAGVNNLIQNGYTEDVETAEDVETEKAMKTTIKVGDKVIASGVTIIITKETKSSFIGLIEHKGMLTKEDVVISKNTLKNPHYEGSIRVIETAEVIETEKAVYKVTSSGFKPDSVFNAVRISKRTGKRIISEAWAHQVQNWRDSSKKWETPKIQILERKAYIPSWFEINKHDLELIITSQGEQKFRENFKIRVV